MLSASLHGMRNVHVLMAQRSGIAMRHDHIRQLVCVSAAACLEGQRRVGRYFGRRPSFAVCILWCALQHCLLTLLHRCHTLVPSLDHCSIHTYTLVMCTSCNSHAGPTCASGMSHTQMAAKQQRAPKAHAASSAVIKGAQQGLCQPLTIASAQLEAEGLLPVPGAIELGAIQQRAHVMHCSI